MPTTRPSSTASPRSRRTNGYEEPIVVDNIKPEEAATQLDGLARQNVDMIAVGAGEIADPLADLTAKYGDIIWYCNCGGGFEELPNLIQSGDDGSRDRLLRRRTPPVC